MNQVAVKYLTMRWVLVQLRRIARCHHINIDNAFESSRKDRERDLAP